jgi:hypothetical protein
VREQCLVDFEQSLLIVDEQIEQVALIAYCKISQFDPVLCELSQFQKRLLKFACLFGILLDLLELLLVVDLVLESALHDILADFLDTVDEKTL